MSLLQQASPIVPVRAFHLDLKGFPPPPDRLLSWLRLVAACGYNAVLVEWEDQFPWTIDERFHGPTCYSPADVRAFADEAERLGLEVIPLVQCLGHVETFLRPEAYAGLRELPDSIDLLNPLAPGARALIERLVADVLELLPNVRRFHLGGDEAWQFGSHPDTRAYIERHGKPALFLKHVEPLLDGLIARGIRPLLWHDMLIEWDGESLQRIGRKADLVVWGYGADPAHTKGHYHVRYIERFAEAGIPLWGATACKGADGADGDLPDVAARQENALAWVRQAQRFRMHGLIATAWSRYSTGRVQSDPTDAALDCVAFVGVILHDGAPPARGIEACREWLASADDADGFTACHAAVAEFAAQLRAGWEYVRVHQGQVWLSGHDGDRDPALPMAILRRQHEGVCSKLLQAADGVRDTLAKHMDRRWAEEYVGSRAAPLMAILTTLADAHTTNPTDTFELPAV